MPNEFTGSMSETQQDELTPLVQKNVPAAGLEKLMATNPQEAQALMAQLKGGELTAQLADVQQAMARMSPKQQEQIMSNLSPEQQGLANMMKDVDPEAAADMVHAVSQMAEGGMMDAKTLVTVIKLAKGKSDEDLKALPIPESLHFARPLLRQLGALEAAQLEAIVQAMLDMHQAGSGKEWDAGAGGGLPVESIIAAHTAFKEIPEGQRMGLVKAFTEAPEYKEYHPLAAAGADTLANLTDDDLRHLVSSYNSNGAQVDFTLWAKVVSWSEARALKDWIAEGPFSLRVLSFMAGLFTLISGTFGIFLGVFSGSWWHGLLNIWVVMVGLLTMIVECKCGICKHFLRRFVEKEVQMLTTVEGRGWFFLFCSTLCLCQWGEDEQICNIVSGWFMFVVGLLNVYTGVLGKRKLQAARAQFITTDENGEPLDDAQLEEKLDIAFDRVDKDGSGDLDREELKLLLREFATELTGLELDTVLMLMDTDADGRISRTELKMWYLADSMEKMEQAAGAIAKFAHQQDVEQMPAGPERDLAEALLKKEQDGASSGRLIDDLRSTWTHVTEAPAGLSVLSFIAGLSLVGGGCAGLLDAIMEIDRETSFAEILVNLYAILIGILTISLEIPNLQCTKWAAELVDHNIRVLRFLWGRGLMYMLGGLLILVQVWVESDFLTTAFAVIGGYTLVVGMCCYILGLYLQCQLNGIKDQLEDEANIEERFQQCDLDSNGELDSTQFPRFLESFGLHLGHNELVATIRELDVDKNGKISKEEFKQWYSHRLIKLPGIPE